MNQKIKLQNKQPESSLETEMAELNDKFKKHKDNPLMQTILKAAKDYIAEKETHGS